MGSLGVVPDGWVHRSASYDSLEEAARLAVAVLADGHRRGRAPLLATLRPDVETAVRAGLGAVADDVTFLPARPQVGQDPGAVVQDQLDRSVGRAWRPVVVAVPDIVVDPWGSACLETEVRATRALAGRDEEHTCLYPHDEPFARLAALSHPLLVDRWGDRPSPTYRDPEQIVIDEPTLAHLDLAATVRDVVPHLDPDLRAWIAEQGRTAGLDPDIVDQVVLAAHEALRAGAESRTERAAAPLDVPSGLGVAHADANGLPSTRLYLHRPRPDPLSGPDTRGRSALVLDVDAAWLPELRSDRLPTDELVRGLWIAKVGCPDLTVSIHPMTAERTRIRVSAPA